MITTGTVRFGMIGAGAIAQAFLKSRAAELVAITDVRSSAAQELAAKVGCQYFTDPDDMFDRVSPDAVLVCTLAATHPQLCLSALRRKVHVLCEKPLAIEYSSAEDMVRVAEEEQVLFAMASKFRYVSDVVQAKSIVNSGALGEIVLFENTFTAHVDMSRRWNSDPLTSGGGVLIDNGTHSVDIIRYFLGPLAELQAVEGKRIQDLPVEDTVQMFVRTQSDVMATIDLSWSFNKQPPHYIIIYGTDGTAHVGWQESKYRRRDDTDWAVFGERY